MPFGSSLPPRTSCSLTKCLDPEWPRPTLIVRVRGKRPRARWLNDDDRRGCAVVGRGAVESLSGAEPARCVCGLRGEGLPALLPRRSRETGAMRSLLLFPPRVKFLVAAFSLMSAWPADADTSRNEEIAERFAAADTNHDGHLTLAEAQAGMPRVAANFSKIDADGSGTVTLAEIEALADR